MSHQRLLNALWKVRQGNADSYQDGINFGIAIGMASCLPYEQHVRVSDLILNAAQYAKKERAK